MTSPSEGRLTVRVEEAAGLLGISRGLAYELVKRGELPSLRLGRRLVVPLSALEELVAGAGNSGSGMAPTANVAPEPAASTGARSTRRRPLRTSTVDEGVGRLPLDGIEGREG
jgi:excisionase family DNA binding protein